MVATPAMRQRSDEVRKLQAEEAAGRVGGTSVTIDGNGRALYFSKKLIPYLPDGTLREKMSPVRLHIGVYAYRRAAIERFVALPPSPLETREKLEQLRALEAGMRIAVARVEHGPFGVDTPADLERARRLLAGTER